MSYDNYAIDYTPEDVVPLADFRNALNRIEVLEGELGNEREANSHLAWKLEGACKRQERYESYLYLADEEVEQLREERDALLRERDSLKQDLLNADCANQEGWACYDNERNLRALDGASIRQLEAQAERDARIIAEAKLDATTWYERWSEESNQRIALRTRINEIIEGA